MKRLRSIVVAVALAATPLSAQVAPSPTELPNDAGPWSPPGTGVAFPQQAGEFRRTRIVEYGSDNWSVGYDRIQDERKVGTTTVFLYVPSGGGRYSAELDGAVQALAMAYPAAVELSRATADSPEGGRPSAARHVRYRMTARFDGADREVLSDTYVYCHPESRWTIKYRSTWPASQHDGGDAAPELLRAIAWPAAMAE